MSALTVNGLCKAFGGLRVTTDVNLSVEPGERRLIIGPNGAGKTTLFNLITGELTPDSGSVRLFGQDLTAHAEPPARAPRHGAHLPDHHAVRPRHLVRNVALALLGLEGALEPLTVLTGSAPGRPRARGTRSGSACATSPSGRCRRRPTASGGGVEIAMALAQKPKVLLLDEPYAGLSIDERRDVQETCAPSRATSPS